MLYRRAYAVLLVVAAYASLGLGSTPTSLPIRTGSGSISRIERLALDAGPTGPRIHALFGRFPVERLASGCMDKSLSMGSPLSRALPTDPCGGGHANCPSGTFPDTGCNSLSKPKNLRICPYNQNCIDWGCQSSTSGCCIVCTWTQTDCWSCQTTGGCS
jgi:hypothetical protein